MAGSAELHIMFVRCIESRCTAVAVICALNTQSVSNFTCSVDTCDDAAVS
jgi:hypothetical protein